MKCKRLMAAATALMLLLTGCGSTQDTAEAEALLSKAQTTMGSVSSMSADMTMEMDMSMDGEVLETTTTAHILTQQEPLKMQMEMAMLMNDGTSVEQMLMYAAEEDGKLKTYIYTADTWVMETMELGDLAQYDAGQNMDLYLDHIADFHVEGEEEINGRTAVKISGVITGDAMEEALRGSGMTDSAASMGLTEEMMQSLYEEMEDLPVSIWIDEEGYVLKYELDMTEMMQLIMDTSMEAVGMTEADLTIRIEKTAITVVCNDFNAVAEIEIPADAQEAYELMID